MKKKIFFLSCLFSMFLLTGCGNSIKNTSDIVKFTYKYGSYNGGYYHYSIDKKNKKVIFTANGLNGVDLKVNKEISKSYLKELSKIINDNGIYKWDGFDKKNKSVVDGYSFYLNVEYQDGKKIRANGYMKYPKNYDNAHKILVNFLQSID